MGGFQIKIVGDGCNLRCRYCRNRNFDQSLGKEMSVEMLEQVIRFASTVPNRTVRMCWHGGEPLIIGKKFFSLIPVFQSRYPEKVWVNSIQTNGTLIDNEYAALFQKQKFSIGLSLDGTEYLHNAWRVFPSGRGSYASAIEGGLTLQNNGIFPSVICTVTKQHLLFAQEIILAFVQSKFTKIAFNAFWNVAGQEADVNRVTDNEWYLFLCSVFEIWIALRNPLIKIREIDQLLALIQNRVPNNCSFQGTCANWFVVNWNGDLFPCERIGYSTFYFGKVEYNTKFSDMTNLTAYSHWKDYVQKVPLKCQACDLLPLCHNGCVAHRHSDMYNANIFAYCESRKRMYAFVQSFLQDVKGRNRKEVSYL
ncbi:MAG: radical SAM protein [Candidatus Pacebacteria bacterium]|nr:radical SAM protein [Candidatus Paceibacterota bacterium]